MNIEIKKTNHFKELLKNQLSKFEDFLFDLILKLPDRLIPSPLMQWLDSYTTKRLNQLKQESVKLNWTSASLEKVVDEISNRQS